VKALTNYHITTAITMNSAGYQFDCGSWQMQQLAAVSVRDGLQQ